jgi:hypothetical protein
MSDVFVERLLQPSESEPRLPAGSHYDDRLDLTVTADGTPLIHATPRRGDTVTKVTRDKDTVARETTTKAGSHRPDGPGVSAWKQTRADRDRPWLRAGKKTAGNRDKPLVRGLRADRKTAVHRDRPRAPTRPGDERVTAVRADKPRARRRPLPAAGA